MTNAEHGVRPARRTESTEFVRKTNAEHGVVRKMNIRTEMILDALVAGFTVVHTDLDVVFFRNPLPHLKV